MKRIFVVFMTFAIVCLCLAQFPTAAEATTSGTCGPNLTWKLENDVLTISGTGAMNDYNYHDGYQFIEAPWDSTHSTVKTIVVEEGVTYIGQGAFTSCYNATSVSLPSTLTEIGKRAFNLCLALESVVIPDNVTTIGEYAFRGCRELKSVTFGKKLETIEDSAFDSCEVLETVSIPASVTFIGKHAFDICKSLTGIWVNEANANYKSDSKGVLYNKSMTRLMQMPGAFTGAYTIPAGVQTIDGGACSSVDGLTEVTIPEGVTDIGASAFWCCDNLSKISVPNSVEVIGQYAFSYNDKLTYTIADSVKYLGNNSNPYVVAIGPEQKTLSTCSIKNGTRVVCDSAFQQCASLKSVMIPDSVVFMGERTFEWCSGLENVTIGSGLKEIPWHGFYECTKLKSVSISGKPTVISEDAFSGCSSLTDFEIPSSVTTIGWRAFAFCSSLQEIVIPEGVTELQEVFVGCTNLKKVVIPASMSSFRYYPFLECNALEEVIYCGTAEQWETIENTELLNDVPRSYHAWKDATCTQLPTCIYCNATGGELADHILGDAATETTGQCCIVCGQEITPALGTPGTEPSGGNTLPDNGETTPTTTPEGDTDGEQGGEEPPAPVAVWIVAGVAAVAAIGGALWIFVLRKRV